MQEIISFSTPQIMSGLALGVLSEQIPLWQAGEEVIFSDSSVQTARPRQELIAIDELPLDIAQSFTLARQRAYVATATGVFRYIGLQTEYEVPSLLLNQPPNGSISRLLTQTQSRCTLVPWGDWIISTDGFNQTKLDKNTGTLTDLAGVPWAYARVIGKYQSHLFAADTDLNGRRVYWSNIDDPETWTASLNNDAGSNPLRDLDSRIRAMVPLGANFAIYSKDQMIVCRYTGGVNVFRFEPALYGIGALNPRSIISINRFNWGLSRRGIFQTDGVQHQYIDEPQVRKWLEANVNWALTDNIIGYHDERDKQVCWCLPCTDGYKTLGFRYEAGTFTLLNTNALFGNEANVFDNVLLAFGTSIQVVGSGTSPASFIESKPLHCGDRTVEKTFQMVRLDMTWSGEVTFALGYGDTAESCSYEQTFTTAGSVSGSLDIDIPDGQRVANYIQLKISAPAGSSFRLGSFSIHGTVAGARK